MLNGAMRLRDYGIYNIECIQVKRRERLPGGLPPDRYCVLDAMLIDPDCVPRVVQRGCT